MRLKIFLFALFTVLVIFLVFQNSQQSKREKKIKILAVGDSLTSGHDVNDTEKYPAILEAKLRENGIQAEVVNLGTKFETTEGLLNRIGEIKKIEADIVIITTGGNDILKNVTPNTTRKNLEAIIVSLKDKYSATDIYLATLNIPPTFGLSYIYSGLERGHGINLVKFVEPDVYFESNLMHPDQVHPNAAGNAYIVQNYIYPEIMKRFQGF